MSSLNVTKGFDRNSLNWLWNRQIKILYLSADWLLCQVSYTLASCCSFTLLSYIVFRLIGAVMNGIIVEKQSWPDAGWPNDSIEKSSHYLGNHVHGSATSPSHQWNTHLQWTLGTVEDEKKTLFNVIEKSRGYLSSILTFGNGFYMFLFFWLAVISLQWVASLFDTPVCSTLIKYNKLAVNETFLSFWDVGLWEREG